MSQSTQQVAPTASQGSSSISRAIIAVALVSAVAMSAAGMLGHSKDAVASAAVAAAPSLQVPSAAGIDTSVPAAGEVIYRAEQAFEEPAPTF